MDGDLQGIAKPIGAIVVGIDAPELNHAAIDWAVEQAALRSIPVRIVHAIDTSLVPGPVQALDPSAWAPVADASLRALAADALRHAEMYAASLATDVEVTTESRDGTPVSVLLEAAGPRDLVAIGSRHLGAFRSALFGSTGIGLAHTSRAPFVVVRGERASSASAPVVAGVAPSTHCATVLGTAFEQAAIQGRTLRAVMGWEPYFYAPHHRTGHGRSRVYAEAELWLAEAVAGWQEAFPEVKVERSLVFGYPTVALVKASVGAGLVVVGVGGDRASRALGSVAAGVLHHAACPVEVVPQ